MERNIQIEGNIQVEGNIQIEGFFDHSICINRFLSKGVFGCEICINSYSQLDESPASIINQIRSLFINYKKYYISYKGIANTDELDKLLIVANIYSNIPFIKSILDIANDIYDTMQLNAKLYNRVWRVIRVFNISILFTFYIYILFYATCDNYRAALVHAVLLFASSIVLSFVNIYAGVVSMIEMVTYMPILLYTNMYGDLLTLSILIFAYLCIVTITHAGIDIVNVRELVHR